MWILLYIYLSLGEMEKLAQGIFHNYPEVCDRKLNNVSISLEWFQFYDLITSLVMHKQIWSLMPYTNYGFIAWHLHLARTQKTKLSYPAVFNEASITCQEKILIKRIFCQKFARISFLEIK